jgi:hypothetical protein
MFGFFSATAFLLYSFVFTFVYFCFSTAGGVHVQSRAAVFGRGVYFDLHPVDRRDPINDGKNCGSHKGKKRFD